MWLKEMESGKFSHEVYIAHTIIENDVNIAILTYSRVLVIRSDTLRLEYGIHLDNIVEVKSGIDGVYLNLKKDTRVLSIEEKTSREWFAKIIDRTMAQRKEDLDRQ
jgi:vacuolar protein sorting-associated protein 13A/C